MPQRVSYEATIRAGIPQQESIQRGLLALRLLLLLTRRCQGRQDVTRVVVVVVGCV
jgi:hypothetical protein